MFHEKNNDEEMRKEEEDELFLDEKKDLFQEHCFKASSMDPQRMNELMDIINGDAEAEENVETEEKEKRKRKIQK